MSRASPFTVGALALAAATAAWMNLGTLHEFQHADSLLPVLVSRQHWTPFFWGQDRFGMLVPLLAMPIRDLLVNLLVQGWLMTAAAWLAPFAVARFLSGRSPEWITIGALTNLFVLAATSSVTQFDWYVAQPYGLSIALGFGGVMLAGEVEGLAGKAGALMLLLLAHWVNVGIAIVLAIAVVFARRRVVAPLALVALGMAGGLLAGRYLASDHTPAAVTPATAWPHGWSALLQNAVTTLAHPGAVMVIAAAAAGALIFTWRRHELERPLRNASVVIAVAVAQWLFVGTSDWVRLNLYYPRYMFPSLMMLGVAAAVIVAAPFRHWARTASTVALAAATLVSAALYGWPSIDRVSRGMDRFGRMTGDVLSSGSVAIAGDYWTVWPAVFHANATLSRARSDRRVYGLTYRSEATDAIWFAAGTRILVAGAPDDATVVRTAERHDVHLTLLEHRPSIDLFAGNLAAMVPP